MMGAVCVVALLAAVSSIRADDDAAKLRAVIDKAIKAHGGADNLKKFPASVIKSKGTYYGMGEGIEYTQEISIQHPGQMRVEVDANNFKFVQVFDKNKGWRKIGDGDAEKMSKEEVAEAQEQMYAGGLTHLVVLQDKSYKLAPLGEIKVGDRAAIGVRVEHEGHRPVSMYFDKDKGLLLKVETNGKDTQNDNKEFTAEELFSEYKKVDGLMVAHKVTINRDGKKYLEYEITEYKPSEKLDDSVFAKP
jgi:outer membrane lipoprotein-sorting protein